MHLISALALFLIAVIAVFSFSQLILCIRPWSSFILALVIGLIVLDVAFPPSTIVKTPGDWSVAAYILIQLGTLLLVVIYVLERSWKDRYVC